MSLSIYHEISALRSFEERAAEGLNGDVKNLGNGWLLKSDKAHSQACAHEFNVMSRLMETTICPEVEYDSNSSFLIQKIDNGATLEEYIMAYLNGLLPGKVLISLSATVADLLANFHEAGWVHGDLHGRNIVIEFDNGWRPYIIDLGRGYHQDDEDGEKDLLIAETNPEYLGSTGDIKYLSEAILGLIGDVDDSDLNEAITYIEDLA